MGLLSSILVKLLEWILVMGGKALYDWTTRLVEERNKRIKAEEALKRYQEAKKKDAKRYVIIGFSAVVLLVVLKLLVRNK